MEEIYNHYSFLWIAIGLTIVAGLVLLTNRPTARDFVSFGVIVVGLLVAWLVLHPRQTALMSDAKANRVDRALLDVFVEARIVGSTVFRDAYGAVYYYTIN